MMRFLITLLVFLGCATANAQLINIKTSVYFDSDSSKVTSKYRSRISSFADTAKKLSIKGILLRGNTDADADSLYNIRLSKKRVLAVKELLTKTGITDTLIHFDFYGENKPIADNETEKGKQRNRRVDIILSATLIDLSKKINTNEIEENLLETIEEVKNTCNKDTTFTLPQGSIVTMNICDYKKQKECGGFSIKEFFTVEDISRAGFVTTDNKGNPLASAGMFSFRTCNGACLDEAIKILIPINENYDEDLIKGMKLWELSTPSDNSSGWKPAANKIRIVKIGKKRFFEYEIKCPVSINIDCILVKEPRKITLKLPKKYKLLSAHFEMSLPIGRYSILNPEYYRKRKAKFCFFCGKLSKKLTLSVKALTPSGDTAIFRHKKLKDLRVRYKIFPGRCHKFPVPQCGNFLWVFAYRKSKIKIREEDFDKIISSKSN